MTRSTRATRVSTRDGHPLVNQNDTDRRTSVERITAAQGKPTDVSPARTGETAEESARGLFQRHSWLIPVTAVLAIIVAFGLMIVLTVMAGGTTPFTS